MIYHVQITWTVAIEMPPQAPIPLEPSIPECETRLSVTQDTIRYAGVRHEVNAFLDDLFR
jgi:hypothetical protein